MVPHVSPDGQAAGGEPVITMLSWKGIEYGGEFYLLQDHAIYPSMLVNGRNISQ